MTFSLNTDPLFIFLMQTQPFTRSHFIILAPSKNLYLLDKTATKKKERKKHRKIPSDSHVKVSILSLILIDLTRDLIRIKYDWIFSNAINTCEKIIVKG